MINKKTLNNQSKIPPDCMLNNIEIKEGDEIDENGCRVRCENGKLELGGGHIPFGGEFLNHIYIESS